MGRPPDNEEFDCVSVDDGQRFTVKSVWYCRHCGCKLPYNGDFCSKACGKAYRLTHEDERKQTKLKSFFTGCGKVRIP